MRVVQTTYMSTVGPPRELVQATGGHFAQQLLARFQALPAKSRQAAADVPAWAAQFSAAINVAAPVIARSPAALATPPGSPQGRKTAPAPLSSPPRSADRGPASARKRAVIAEEDEEVEAGGKGNEDHAGHGSSPARKSHGKTPVPTPAKAADAGTAKRRKLVWPLGLRFFLAWACGWVSLTHGSADPRRVGGGQ